MTVYNATQIPSYSPTVDITSLLRSWCSPGRIDKITMAHVRLDMIAVDSLVQPRLDRIKELESEIARLRAEVDVISPTLDKYHSLHAPIRRLPPEVLLSIFCHLEPGPMPLIDDAPWLLTRVCSSWRDLVTHTPTLWSTIKMDSPYNFWNLSHYHPHQHYTSSDLSRTSSLLTSSLRYSQNVPLDITLNSRLPNPSIDRVTTPLSQHSNRWRSLVTDLDGFIPMDLPVLERLDLRIFSELFNSLQAPHLHTLIIGELYSIPFSRFPSLRCLECYIIDSEQLITLLEGAKQLTSLRVDCKERSVHRKLPSSGITTNLLELHLPTKVPKGLSCISFPLLHSLTLGLPLCDHPGYNPEDVGILNNLHCPRLRTLIFNDTINILPLNKLLSCPITRLDLVVRAKSVYHALISKPLLHLEDLRITDESPWSEEILNLVKAKRGLRNVEVKSASFERIREMFRMESFSEELTISFSVCSHGY